MGEKKESLDLAEASQPTEDMDIEKLDFSSQNLNARDDANGDSKSKR
ncbi:hypothetical protein Golob_025414, partial [Gossypium lobatum]|nr:hypothetical protein [Gossypium lobatum]